MDVEQTQACCILTCCWSALNSTIESNFVKRVVILKVKTIYNIQKAFGINAVRVTQLKVASFKKWPISDISQWLSSSNCTWLINTV